MNKIINLTQHASTVEQADAGVVEPTSKSAVKALLDFEQVPTRRDLLDRAVELADMAAASGAKAAMVGGAPFFMVVLERELLNKGVTPLYAFSRRESVERTGADGTTVKTSVFKHVGFVPAFDAGTF